MLKLYDNKSGKFLPHLHVSCINAEDLYFLRKIFKSFYVAVFTPNIYFVVVYLIIQRSFSSWSGSGMEHSSAYSFHPADF